jgi:Tol biopolymer transport system component
MRGDRRMTRQMRGLTTLLVAAGLTTAFAATATDARPTRPGSEGKIAFASSEDDPGGDIWTMNADGSERVNLTPGRPEQDAGPNWSPDGSRIVFTSIAADGNWDVLGGQRGWRRSSATHR